MTHGDLTGLEVRGEVASKTNDMAFGIRPDALELVSLVNRALASISFEEKQAIRARWVPEVREPLRFGSVVEYTWPYLLAAALIIAVVLAWNRSLMLQARRRELAEEAALATHRQLIAMTNSLPLVVFQRRIEPNGERRYTFLGEPVKQLFGAASAAIIQNEELLWQGIHEEDRETLRQQVWGAEDSQQPLRVQFRVGQGDTARWIDSASTVTQYADGIQERNGFWLDVTALKAAQEAAETARQVAEAATRVKSEFLANMSHEIRTPMNAIIGISHLLVESNIAPKQRNQAVKLQRSAKSLLGVINDILDFSKIEAGKLTVESVQFALNAVLSQWADLLGQQAAEKGLELLFVLAPQLPTTLIGDPLRLGQVLVNLGSNAVKFTSSGGVTLSIEETHRDTRHVRLLFSVSDTGVGMSEAEQQRLFVPFAQGDSSISRRFGGTGLGLAISRHLVERMGGQLTVKSALGSGSTFQFETSWRLAVTPPNVSAPRWASFNGERLLVIDDNAGTRKVLSDMARAFGLHSESAADAHDGLLEIASSRSAGKPYKIVLLDLKMKDMDGIECARRILAAPNRPGPAVLLTTTFTDDDIVARLKLANIVVQDILVKPVTPSALFDACTIALRYALPSAMTSAAEETPRIAARAQLKGARVLLVEDNEINQELEVELLKGAGIEVVVAGDGGQALTALGLGRFDAVLMDCQMPMVDGYEATRAIRARREWHDLPIIAMTANAMSGDRARALDAGMNDHIAKPIDVGAMFSTLEYWLRR